MVYLPRHTVFAAAATGTGSPGLALNHAGDTRGATRRTPARTIDSRLASGTLLQCLIPLEGGAPGTAHETRPLGGVAPALPRFAVEPGWAARTRVATDAHPSA